MDLKCHEESRGREKYEENGLTACGNAYLSSGTHVKFIAFH
jgi:hypothetical protein